MVPILVYFQLELLDRDVSANLRVHRLDPISGEVRPYEAGKDPTEIVHDRERERYSTHLSRTLPAGTYFVEVNANHPDYVLRTRTYPVPPLADPGKAVQAGLDYLLNAGDAWFAQIPREGNLFVRSGNLHDTATRCTACHASSFPTEAALVGQANGYPIRSKAGMQYLMDRLENSPTPLYGDDGLFWQRFIAIPLQAQGKQGGIVLDFGHQVEGRDSPLFERFGPFLKAAWRGRRSLARRRGQRRGPARQQVRPGLARLAGPDRDDRADRPGRLRPGRRRRSPTSSTDPSRRPRWSRPSRTGSTGSTPGG